MSTPSVMTKPLVAENICELIGRTPMVKLGKLNTTDARILLKLESENPAASVKDRLAYNMVKGAERDGLIKPGDTLLEATSGNTGVALAMVGAALGYKVIIAMPETMSLERRALIRLYGARLILTPAKLGVKASIAVTEKLAKEIEGSHMTRQFWSPYNAQIHRETTGPEIWEQTEGKVDVLVIGSGTGGTVTGVAQFIKPLKDDIKVVTVEPAESQVLAGKPPAPHKIQGLNPGFKPETLDMAYVDEVVPVPSDDAIAMARQLASAEGIFAGASAGAAVQAALAVAARPESKGKTLVAVIPSFGERYLSTPVYSAIMDEVKAQQAEDPENVTA